MPDHPTATSEASSAAEAWQRASAADAWGTAVAPTAPLGLHRKKWYAELDQHRGVAVLLLVIFNVYQFCNVGSGLFLGSPAHTVLSCLDAAVPWLFVITAFLLFEPIVRATLDGGPQSSPRAFLSRRALRLLPVYYVAVIVVWFIRQPSLPGDWRDLLEHLTFTQVFDDKRIFYTNGPAWAVSVMVYFDLFLAGIWAVLPTAMRQLTTRERRLSALVAVPVGLIAVSEIWKAVAFALGHRPLVGSSRVWFGPLANLDSFAIGMLLAVLVVAAGDVPRLSLRRRVVLRSAATAFLAVAFATREADGWSAVFFDLECSLGFGCLVAAAVVGAGNTTPRSSFVFRLATRLGVIAYSLYLWHEPVQLALNNWHGVVRQSPSRFWPDVLVITALSIATAWFSYVVVERPARRLSSFLRRQRLANEAVYLEPLTDSRE